jgi:hypothetical protein
MPEIKLCKDCRFLSLGELAAFAGVVERMDSFSALAECHHPSARRESKIDLVTGKVTQWWERCAWHRLAGYRDEDQNCGPHGLWFQPKEPPEPVGFADDGPPPRLGGATAEPELPSPRSSRPHGHRRPSTIQTKPGGAR